jgi:hypothetical protein
MPLESPLKPGDLNENWPLSSDPASFGANHLRTIKKMLKGNILGAFSTRELLTSFLETAVAAGFQMQNGCLAFVNGAWYALEAVSAGSNNINNSMCFPATSTIRATRVAQRGVLSAQNQSGLVSINSSQRRRPLVAFIQVAAATSFDSTAANAAFPDGVPVGNDVCIQLLPANNGQAEVRFYNGASWNPVDDVIYSRSVAYTLLATQMILAVSVDTTRVRTRQLEVMGNTNVYVIDPDGFGPDSLVKWFGAKLPVTGLNGELSYSSMTIANAISYETLDGKSGSGGQAPDPDPTPPGDATVLTDLGTLGTAYEAFNEEFFDFGAQAVINVTVKPDGTFVISAFRERTGEPPSGPLLSEVAAGIGSQFEVRFTPVGGTSIYLSGPVNQWLIMNTDRTVSLVAESDQFNRNITRTQNLQVEVRKIGGASQTKTISLLANAVTNAGAVP